MSYSVTVSGHTDGKEKEASVITTMRNAVKETPSATYASMSTQYHGTVDLFAADEEGTNGEADANPAVPS